MIRGDPWPVIRCDPWHEKRGCCHAEVDRRGDLHRAGQPHPRDEHVTGRERPDQGPRRVRRVEQRGAPPDLARSRECASQHERHRRAHHRRRDEQDRRRAGEARKSEHAGLISAARGDLAVDRRHPCQERRRRQRGKPYERFRGREPSQRKPDAIRQSTSQVAAQRQSAHEGGEHGAGRVHGDAEDQAEEADPDDLIDQR